MYFPNCHPRGSDGGFVRCVVSKEFRVFIEMAAVPEAAVEAVSCGCEL